MRDWARCFKVDQKVPRSSKRRCCVRWATWGNRYLNHDSRLWGFLDCCRNGRQDGATVNYCSSADERAVEVKRTRAACVSRENMRWDWVVRVVNDCFNFSDHSRT